MLKILKRLLTKAEAPTQAYLDIEAYSHEDLSRCILELMKDGWQPDGRMSVSPRYEPQLLSIRKYDSYRQQMRRREMDWAGTLILPYGFASPLPRSTRGGGPLFRIQQTSKV